MLNYPNNLRILNIAHLVKKIDSCLRRVSSYVIGLFHCNRWSNQISRSSDSFVFRNVKPPNSCKVIIYKLYKSNNIVYRLPENIRTYPLLSPRFKNGSFGMLNFSQIARISAILRATAYLFDKNSSPNSMIASVTDSWMSMW